MSESDPPCTIDPPYPGHISTNSTASDFDLPRKAVAPAYLKNAKHLLIPAITLSIAIILTMLADTNPSTYRAAKAQSPTSTDTPTPTPTVVPEPAASCGSSPLNGRTQKVVDVILAAVTTAEPTITNCQDVTPAHLTAITSLNISSKTLTMLRSNDFNGLSNLLTLRLNNNQLTVLHQDIFDGLSALTNLPLQQNQLASLHQDIFDGLSALTHLSLQQNQLTSLHEDIFDGLSALTNLSLQENQLASLHQDIFDDLSALTHLYLQQNQLASLHQDTFDGLSNLRRFTLDNNQLNTLHEDIFDDLSALTHLYLQQNQLTSLHQDLFDSTTNLQDVNIGNNQITSLDKDIFDGLTNLRIVSVVNNQITTLDKDIFNGLSSLQTINLARNQLTSLHEDIFNGLTNLLVIHLNTNQITSLHKDIFNELSSLQTINLPTNQIASLDKDIFDGLANLGNIDISFNQITALDKDIFDGLTNLANLNLATNQIASLHKDTFNGLSNLQTLILSNNQITSLPEPATATDGTTTSIFNRLSSLRALYLHGNQLTTLHQNLFKGMESLTLLSVYENEQLINPEPAYFQNQELTSLGRLWFGNKRATSEQLENYKAFLPALFQLTLNEIPPTEVPPLPVSDETEPITYSPQILRIEPDIESVALRIGEKVRLKTRIFGLQNQHDDSLADDASPAEVSFEWSATNSAGQFTESTNHKIRTNQQPDDRTVLYTAPEHPGEYTVTAELDTPQECAGNEEQCRANFKIIAKRSIYTQPSSTPIPCVISGATPSAIADSKGNQYAVFTPAQGGTFTTENEEAEITAPPGAIPGCQYIGIRIDKAEPAANRNNSLYRFTLAGDTYSVSAIDSSGVPISDYRFDRPAQLCIPLPPALRSNIADIYILKINSENNTLTALTSKIITTPNQNPKVCGALRNIPAQVAAGKRGAPDPTPIPMPTATSEPPTTGGTVVPYSFALLITLLGITILTLGISILLSKPKHPTTH